LTQIVVNGASVTSHALRVSAGDLQVLSFVKK
jgi:hypothetical protein